MGTALYIGMLNNITFTHEIYPCFLILVLLIIVFSLGYVRISAANESYFLRL